MSIEEARTEPGAERTTEIARRNPTDPTDPTDPTNPTVEILGAPRKVRVLAFEPDERRTGEWRARQFALNRFAPDRQTAMAPPMPTLPVIAAPRRQTSPREIRSALPIPFPPRRAETVSLPPSPNGRRVGVEIVTSKPFPSDRVRYFLTLAEQRQEVPERRMLWALKEATWKALGRNEPHPCTALELTFDDDGTLRGAILDGVRFAAGGYTVSPWPEHILAVVWIERGQS